MSDLPFTTSIKSFRIYTILVLLASFITPFAQTAPTTFAAASVATPVNSDNSSILTINAPAVVSGDLLLAQLTFAKDLSSNFVVCPPSGWTSVGRAVRAPSSQIIIGQEIFSFVAPSTRGQTAYTWNFRTGNCATGSNVSNKGISAGIARYTGVYVADYRGNSGQSTTSVTTANVTAAAGDHVVWFIGAQKLNVNITAPSTGPARLYQIQSTSQFSNNERTAAAFGRTQASGGTATFTANFSTSAEWVAQTVLLKSKASQTINFSPLIGKTFGDPSFAVSAIASSGLPVTFAVKNPATDKCTLSSQTVNSAVVSMVHLTGAGSCTIVASQDGNFQFNAAPPVERTFSIAKANQGISWGALDTKTFGDPSFDLNGTASSLMAVQYAVVANVDGSPAGKCTVNGVRVTINGAGLCTIQASQAGNENYNAAPIETRYFEIQKANAAVTLEEGSLEHTYDKTEKEPVVSTLPAGLQNVLFEYRQNGVVVARPTNAGEYDVVATLNNPNYQGHVTGQLVIMQKPITGRLTVGDKTYDGNITASIKDRTLDGVIDGDDVTLVGGSAIFGDKHVGFDKSVTGTGFALTGVSAGNYRLDTPTLTTLATVTPKAITGSFTAADKEYDGTTTATIVERLLQGVITGDDVRLSGGDALFNNKDVGQHTFVVGSDFGLAGNDKHNYSLSTVGNTTATITPRPITVEAEAQSKVYGATDPDLTYYVTSGALVDGESLNGRLIRVSGENVGVYSILQGSLTAGSNYKIIFVGSDLTISKAASTTAVTVSNGVYTGQPHGGSATVIGAGGLSQNLVVTYTGRNGTSYGPSTTPPTNAGDYTASASFAESTNHLASSDSKDFTIGKANATIVVQGVNRAYDGTAYGATGTASGVNNEDLSSLLDLGGTFVDAGEYTVNWSFAGNDNYLADGGFATIIIGVGAASIVIQDYNGTYDGTAYGVTGSATGVNNVDMSGLLNLGELFVDAGEYIVQWYFVGDANHKPSSGTANITISKAASTTAVTVSNGVYTGQPHGGSATVIGAGGLNQNLVVTYTGRNGTSYGPSTTPPTNAGDYTASANFAESTNHLASSDSKDFTIAKSATTTVVTVSNGIYNGQPTGGSATANGAGGLEQDLPVMYTGRNGTSYGPSIMPPTNAGNYTAGANFAESANHLASSDTKDFIIAQREVTVTADAKRKTQGTADPVFTYQVTAGSLVSGDSINGSLSRVAGETPGTYPIQQGSLALSNNYVLTYVGASLTITPSTWTISGFYQPVGEANTLKNFAGTTGTVYNTVKGGSTVPLKFNIVKNGTETNSLADIKGFAVAQVACPKAAPIEPIDLAFVTTGSTSLRYDGIMGQGGLFIQNWRTPSVPSATCYRVTMTTQDNSNLVAFFQINR